MRTTSAILLTGAITLAATACSTDEAESTRWTSDDIEYQLNALDGNDRTDANADKFARALDNAEPVCTEDRRMIGDMAFTMREQIQDQNGPDVTILELIEAIPESVPEEMRPTECAQILAGLAVLITNNG